MTTTVYTGIPARGWHGRVRALAPPLAVVAAGGLCCAGLLLGDPTTPGGPFPLCPTRLLFGLSCPGCGGLRMTYSLLRGDFTGAVHYNAVALLVVPLFAWGFAAWVLGRLRGRPMRSWLHWRWTPKIIAVVFVLWFVARNLPFAPFTALHV